METFYKQEDLEVFRKWVYYQVVSDPRLTLEKYDSRTYKIYYKKRVARFVIWPIGIVEEAIIEGEELLFYLHYQFYNFHYATNLFHRSLAISLENKRKLASISAIPGISLAIKASFKASIKSVCFKIIL